MTLTSAALQTRWHYLPDDPSDNAREVAFASNEINLMTGKREQRRVDSATKRDIKFDAFDTFDTAEFQTVHINRTTKLLGNLEDCQALGARSTSTRSEVRRKQRQRQSCFANTNGYLGADCSAGGLYL